MGSAKRAGMHWPAAVARLLGLLLAAALALALTSPAGAEAAPVLVLRLQGAVDPASADYLVRGLRTAEQDGAPAVVIELDTPGGLDASMRQLIQAFLKSPVPVLVYVTPQGARAASAGTYLLYAAHVAAMAPATTLGAATPVALGVPGRPSGPDEVPARPPAKSGSDAKDGKDAKDTPSMADAMTAKHVHDAAALIRGLAQLRGRNAEWAEQAVREAVSLTAQEALAAKVVDLVARDLDDLLAQADGRPVRVAGEERRLATRGAATRVLLPDWRHQLLSIIAHPNVALVLMMVGIWGVFFEFAAPGHGISGVTGTICLLLALFALQLLPVNYAGLALMILGVGLLLAELFAPSFGVLGVGGMVAIAAGAIMLFDPETTGMEVPLALVAALTVTSGAVVLFAGGVALRARRRPVVSGREGLVGATGEVLQSTGGETWAEVLGERWKVVASEALEPGQRVRVLALHGLTLQVQPDPPPAAHGGAPP
jgi:membrane-bound serine protease (ClpP class)